MNILSIDTATELLSLALDSGGNGVWSCEADAGRRHSELIMDCITSLMQKAQMKPEELSGVVCMGGPGSFTGLRIGFSLAKGLSLSLGIPFAPIPTLDCMARPFSSRPGIVVPVIDARQGAFFCALYRGGKKLCADMDAKPSAIAAALEEAVTEAGEKPNEQALLIGPGAEMLYEQLTAVRLDTPMQVNLVQRKDLRCGNALSLLEIARETDVFAAGGKAANGAYLDSGPEYIRKSDAEIQWLANSG